MQMITKYYYMFELKKLLIVFHLFQLFKNNS